jgi:hypothetical protein
MPSSRRTRQVASTMTGLRISSSAHVLGTKLTVSHPLYTIHQHAIDYSISILRGGDTGLQLSSCFYDVASHFCIVS